ncbi:hypothetical protein ACH3XX_00515 [Streptomyces scabiei]|uniref:hypothetical protein n=1 Tax=Streptomyces scabiei TaxID=1930 RepID=UPI0037A6C6C1
MTTSSHPFGFYMPGPAPAPVPLHQAPAAHTAVAVPLVAPPTHREPLLPMCVTCGARRGPLVPSGDLYDNGARQFICASRDCTPGPLEPAVLAGPPAAPPRPPVTPAPEADAVRTYDAATVEAIVQSARAQERAEMRAELTNAAEAAEAGDWFHTAWLATAPLQEGYRAVRQLIAGRRLDDWLSVSEVLRAVEGKAPASAPLTVTWDGQVSGSEEDRPGETTLVGCTAALGGSAVLALDDDQRVDLAVRLLATVPAAVRCGNTCCGTPTRDLIESDPKLWGGIVLDVVGTTGGRCWWCSPACAIAAMNTAGAGLAAADQLVATDPARQAPALPAEAEGLADEGEAHCARCGCSARRRCPGGCYWVLTAALVVMCSSCASPEDIVPAPLPGGAR